MSFEVIGYLIEPFSHWDNRSRVGRLNTQGSDPLGTFKMRIRCRESGKELFAASPSPDQNVCQRLRGEMLTTNNQSVSPQL